MAHLIGHVAVIALSLVAQGYANCIQSSTYKASDWDGHETNYSIICPADGESKTCHPDNCECCCHAMANVPGACTRGGISEPPERHGGHEGQDAHNHGSHGNSGDMLYDTKEEADAAAIRMGCTGSHEMDGKWMPGENHGDCMQSAEHTSGNSGDMLYDTREEADAAASRMGCTGSHQMGDKWMPGENHGDCTQEAGTSAPSVAPDSNTGHRTTCYVLGHMLVVLLLRA